MLRRLLGAFRTTLASMHIALRSPVTLAEHRVAQGSQLLAHLLVDYRAVVAEDGLDGVDRNLDVEPGAGGRGAGARRASSSSCRRAPASPRASR